MKRITLLGATGSIGLRTLDLVSSFSEEFEVAGLAARGSNVERIADLRPAGTLSFSGYEQIIPAALAGHGVALGRSPLVKDLLSSKELVAPFTSTADPARAYFAIVAKNAAARPEVAAFVDWLKREAAKR